MAMFNASARETASFFSPSSLIWIRFGIARKVTMPMMAIAARTSTNENPPERRLTGEGKRFKSDFIRLFRESHGGIRTSSPVAECHRCTDRFHVFRLNAASVGQGFHPTGVGIEISIHQLKPCLVGLPRIK